MVLAYTHNTETFGDAVLRRLANTPFAFSPGVAEAVKDILTCIVETPEVGRPQIAEAVKQLAAATRPSTVR
jgi:hypothetical protein